VELRDVSWTDHDWREKNVLPAPCTPMSAEWAAGRSECALARSTTSFERLNSSLSSADETASHCDTQSVFSRAEIALISWPYIVHDLVSRHHAIPLVQYGYLAYLPIPSPE